MAWHGPLKAGQINVAYVTTPRIYERAHGKQGRSLKPLNKMKLDLFQNRQTGEKSLGAVNKRPKPAREPPKDDVKLIVFDELFSGTFAPNVSLMYLIEDL